nr:androgen-induced gene 1 protein-like [Onthophagus taurus]
MFLFIKLSIYTIIFVSHAAQLAAAGYLINKAADVAKELFEENRNNSLKYLTIWNVILQCIYCFASIVNCILSLNHQDKFYKKLSQRLSKMLKLVNISLISPIGLLVVSIFWMVYTIDRELVYPKKIDQVFPTIMNHAAHSFVIFLPIFEIFAQRNVSMPSFKLTVWGLSGFLFMFVCTLFGTYYFSSVWLYGFVNVIPWPAKIWFIVISYVGSLSALGLATVIHSKLLLTDIKIKKN